MPHINLLPWREEQRTQRNKDFAITCFVFVAITILVIGGVHYWFNQRIAFQNERNGYLEDQIASLNKKIEAIKNLKSEREALLARMQIIQQLQASRPEIVHLFDEIVQTLPDGVFYTKITQKGRALNLEGIAQSNARISTLMRNIEASQWMDRPVLDEIVRKDKPGIAGQDLLRLSDFKLKAAQTKIKKDGEDEGDS